MLQEEGKMVVRIQTQMGTFMSHDSWAQGEWESIGDIWIIGACLCMVR